MKHRIARDLVKDQLGRKFDITEWIGDRPLREEICRWGIPGTSVMEAGNGALESIAANAVAKPSMEPL